MDHEVKDVLSNCSEFGDQLNGRKVLEYRGMIGPHPAKIGKTCGSEQANLVQLSMASRMHMLIFPQNVLAAKVIFCAPIY